jgi:hypothetical protein
VGHDEQLLYNSNTFNSNRYARSTELIEAISRTVKLITDLCLHKDGDLVVTYFQTDYEMDPDDEYIEGHIDAQDLASESHLNPKLYDFIETSHDIEVHENYEDLVEEKIFKYKYRQNADDPGTFSRRMTRVIDRFWERAKTRDPAIDADIVDVY